MAPRNEYASLAHLPEVPARLVVLVDDLRSFRDERPALVARSSAAGVALLRELHEPPHDVRGRLTIDELWLDHDLGGADTIMPVVEYLQERAFSGDGLDVRAVFVHSANPVGADSVVLGLRRFGYPVSRAATDLLVSTEVPGQAT